MDDIHYTYLMFVYGSMKKYFMNHFRLVNTAIYLAEAVTIKKYTMYPSESYKFPYVVEDESRFHIKGELYSLEDELLKILDIFEGHPIYYEHKFTEVKINDTIFQAQIYFRADSNPKNYDKETPTDEWKLEHEYKGYQHLEHEIYNLVREKINE